MTLLLDCTIQASIILIIGLGATWILRRQSAALRHGILATAMVCSALAPVVSLALPAWNFHSWLDTAAASVPPALTVVQSTTTEQAAGSSLTPAAPTLSPKVLEAIWLMGIAAGFATLIVGAIRLRRIAAYSETLRDGMWMEATQAISQRYGLRRPVRALRSSNPSILVTWGARRPEIVLPAGSERWPEERIRVVLSHELAHIQRYDWPIQMTMELLRAVYWFNPLFWIACSRLRQESEYACDNAAIAEGIDGTEYAAHLLDLARTLNTGGKVWSAALAMARPSTVQRRFKAMLNPTLNRRPVTRVALLTIALVALLVTLPVGSWHSTVVQAQAPIAATQKAGRLIVTVTDTNGAIVPNATVVVSGPNGNTEAMLTMGNGSLLAFGGLAAGPHVVQVFATGFGPSRMTTVELKPAEDLKQEVKMDIGFVNSSAGLPTASAAKPNSVATKLEPYGGYSVTGSVMDPAGLPIPEVEVTVGAATVLTDEQGRYRILAIQAGKLPVSFALPGFKTLNVANVEIADGQTTTVNANLQVAPTAEEMTVTPKSSAETRVWPPATGGQRGSFNQWTPGSTTGGSVQNAMLLEQARPAYPADAIAAAVQGVVVMEGIIGKAGTLVSVRIISGNPLLQQTAIDTVTKWRYSPTYLDGQPVEVPTTITMNFSLN